MKHLIVAATGLGLLVSAAAFAQDTKKATPPPAAGAPASTPVPTGPELRTKASYSLGMSIGKSLKAQSVDCDADQFAQGLKDALAGKPKFSDEEARAVMEAFEKQVVSTRLEVNKKAGDAYLAANKTKPGVITLPSGLQYKVLKEGTGKTPKATDTVIAHYKGTLIDGTEFDSSYKRGEPLTIPVNGVIAGWTEALQKMKVGSKWSLTIPSELAYGANPQPGSPIGPNSVLLFDIELINIK